MTGSDKIALGGLVVTALAVADRRDPALTGAVGADQGAEDQKGVKRKL